MKQIIFTLTLLLGFLFICEAQTKPPAPKPKGPPSPFIQKKDFDEKIQEIEAGLDQVRSSNAFILSKISKGNDSFYVLKRNIDTIIKILQEYNIKINLTSDSLSLTSFSIAEFRQETKTDIENLKVKSENNTGLVLISLAGIALLIVLVVIVFVVLNKKIKNRFNDLEESMDEFLEKAQADSEDLQNTLKTTLSKDIDLAKMVMDSKIRLSVTELNNSIKSTKDLIHSTVSATCENLDKKIRKLEKDISDKNTG